jgi:hypothetical protein
MIDHDLLTPYLAELRSGDTRCRVCSSPRAPSHKQADRLGRKVLGTRHLRYSQYQQRASVLNYVHDSSFTLSWFSSIGVVWNYDGSK